MSAGPGTRVPSGEGGYAMAALVAAVTIMLIVMAAALPSWKYVMKNDREEELLFRGNQIAEAIERYQKKRGNLLPTSIDLRQGRQAARRPRLRQPEPRRVAATAPSARPDRRSPR